MFPHSARSRVARARAFVRRFAPFALLTASIFASLVATDRPAWAYSYGNTINEGNSALNASRLVAGRKFISLGIVGAWHSDPMTNIRRNANPATNGGELSAQAIH